MKPFSTREGSGREVQSSINSKKRDENAEDVCVV
jgi:hypothetical protein